VQPLGVHDAQNVEGAADRRLHHDGETEKPTLLELRRGIPTRVAQVNPEDQDKDFTWKSSYNWNVCSTTVVESRTLR
jgi:hypothetical protein